MMLKWLNEEIIMFYRILN